MYKLTKKRIFVIDDICNGCRLCEMECSFVNAEEFNPLKSRIQIARIDSEGMDTPFVDCDGSDCPAGEPKCVEICPTGALLYTTLSDATKKKSELVKSRFMQPIFKIIVPWKWPFVSHWQKWPFEIEEDDKNGK